MLNATAGWSTLIADMAGVPLPVMTSPLQAAVTEPVKPFLSTVIVSGTLHVYISQTDRGELVFGASVDPFTSYSMRGSLEFIEGLAGHVLELMPALSQGPAAAAVGGAVRHDTRLLADHGHDAGGRASSSTWAGAPTGSRPARCRERRWRSASPPASPPEIIAAFGLERFADGRARRREGRGRRRPLIGKVPHDPPALSLVRPA